jgi:hypothetical protein
MKNQAVKIIILSIVAIGLGLGSAYFTRGTSPPPDTKTTSDGQEITAVAPEDKSTIKKGDVFGSNNEAVFKDNATGYLQAGGFEDEGSHTLMRAGGKSQYVYLTSSVTDLDKFIGMEIRVWGETFRGEKAGWLMDVGRVEVVDTQGVAPTD